MKCMQRILKYRKNNIIKFLLVKYHSRSQQIDDNFHNLTLTRLEHKVLSDCKQIKQMIKIWQTLIVEDTNSLPS